MSKKDSQKRKKNLIKKTHLWPSIVFLVLSINLLIVTSALFVGLILSYFANDRIQSSYNNITYAAGRMKEADTPEERRDILKDLERDKSAAKAAYIIDKKGMPLDGYGDMTFVDEELADLTYVSDIVVYKDVHSVATLFDEDMNVDVERLIELDRGEGEGLYTFNIKEVFNLNEKKVVYEDYYWLGEEISPDQRIVIKYKVFFYNHDFFLAFLIGILSFAVMMLPVIFLFVNLLINIKNQKRMTAVIYTDKATGGNNFTYFEQEAGKLIARRKRSGRLLAVVDITMMKYRSYCICHGVSAGEDLLTDIDRCLKSMMTKEEICAHHEKADFALLLLCKDRDSCVERVEEMLCKLPEALGHSGNLIFHAGIYFVATGKAEGSVVSLKNEDIDVAEFYNRAESARSSISDANQAVAATFDQMLLEKQLWEHKVEERMQAALDNEEFKVYLQPKYNPVTEKLSGAEALVRWINDEDGFIPPGKFIPIFEENGFIVKLDDYMISHVARLQAGWLEKGMEVVPVSVNVSRAHFANPDLAEHICALVDEHKVPHELIEIELTESAFFDDKKALLDTVGRLHDLGFEVSMDDFGAGYSSLNSLKDLPLDVLKLDAEFFRGEGGEERGEIVVAQAINLAKQLNMRIVAEGVEKKDQVDFLAAQDCDMIQGFYFAKPMPADEYEKRL